MADTAQVVQWMLERGCRLRTGKAETEISAATAAVATAANFGRSLARSSRGFGIFGDVYVTSATMATLPPRLASTSGAYYPSTGYVISEKFKDLGGSAGLQAMCRECPANTARPFPAGCVGCVLLDPWSREIHQMLAAIVSRLGLQSALANNFVTTTPIWFGLWSRSPLTPEAAGLLVTLVTNLNEAIGETSTVLEELRGTQLDEFIAALQIAQSQAAKIHVRLNPPGHTDLGSYTIFPHCPLCKAGAQLARWQLKYPVEPCTCKVCGTPFSPAAQAWSERDDYAMEPELRKIFGAERFREFARGCLVAGGMSEPDAAETVELSEAAEVARREGAKRERLERAAHGRYVQKCLFAGLRTEKIVDPDAPSQVFASGFRAEEFEKLLHRCHERKIRITGMTHLALSQEMWRTVHQRFGAEKETFDPLKTLRKWQAEGCTGVFMAYVEVPRSLITAFENEVGGDGNV